MKGIGPTAFIAGVVIAVLGGLFSSMAMQYQAWIGLVLVALGLVVGFLNVKDKETTPFLVAAVALMASSPIAGWMYLNDIANIGTVIQQVLGYVGMFVAPAAVIVALKSAHDIAKD